MTIAREQIHVQKNQCSGRKNRIFDFIQNVSKIRLFFDVIVTVTLIVSVTLTVTVMLQSVTVTVIVTVTVTVTVAVAVIG